MTRNNAIPLDGISALHMDAKRFPKGIEGLAYAIARSPGALYNKFSDADDRYAVTDREADVMAAKIFADTGLHGYIDAKCATHGGVFVPLPDGLAGEGDLMAGQLEITRRLGDLAAEFSDARDDGRVTREEFMAVRVAAHRAVRQILRWLGDLEVQVDDSVAADMSLRVVGKQARP